MTKLYGDMPGGGMPGGMPDMSNMPDMSSSSGEPNANDEPESEPQNPTIDEID